MKYVLRSGLAKLALVLIAPFFAAGSCGGPILSNRGFDLWCGDTLCDWQVDEGAIVKAPTWHERDLGVALKGNRVQISQLVDLTSDECDCITFELIADKEENDVDIFLEMDFLDDGTVEYSHPIPSVNWSPLSYNITPPFWYDSVRFIVRKVGSERAVLAQIGAFVGMDCTADPLKMKSGLPCWKDDQCLAGQCVDLPFPGPPSEFTESFCGTCESNLDCASGLACGLELESAEHWLHTACGAPQRHALGERCLTDEECMTDICCEGQCSQCCKDNDCPNEQQCARRPGEDLGEGHVFLGLPHQCDAGQGKGMPGAACLFGEDCDSGSCVADDTLSLCTPDGRRCDTDEDCQTEGPWDPLWEDESWWPVACLPLGMLGGVCT